MNSYTRSVLYVLLGENQIYLWEYSHYFMKFLRMIIKYWHSKTTSNESYTKIDFQLLSIIFWKSQNCPSSTSEYVQKLVDHTLYSSNTTTKTFSKFFSQKDFISTTNCFFPLLLWYLMYQVFYPWNLCQTKNYKIQWQTIWNNRVNLKKVIAKLYIVHLAINISKQSSKIKYTNICKKITDFDGNFYSENMSN